MENYSNSITIPISLLLISLAYSYFLVSHIPKGLLRFLFVLPNLYILFLIPWYSISSSFLRGFLSFFITWITSFKLILFCFDTGFLSSCNNFFDFILVAIFPIKINTDGTFELLQLFDKPYLATSLGEFWGRRWNRLSSNILRQTIYSPTQNRLKGVVGVKAAKMVALIVTLVVSGIMHELMFYYITCGKRPTWECALFFVLQGVWMVLEVFLRLFCKAMGWEPKLFYPFLANFLTLGFVVTTFYWLLLLPVWRSGQSICNSLPKAFGTNLFF